MAVFLIQQGELLHSGEDYAAGLAFCQQLAQRIAIVRLYRFLF